MSGTRSLVTHERFVDMAATSIDFRLSPQDEGALRDHLARCPGCAQAAAALWQDAAILGRQPRVDAPWAVQDAVLRAAGAGHAMGRSSGRPSIGLMLGLALPIVAEEGRVRGRERAQHARPPAPDQTQPVTVVRPSQSPRRATEPPATPAREPRGRPRSAPTGRRWAT